MLEAFTTRDNAARYEKLHLERTAVTSAVEFEIHVSLFEHVKVKSALSNLSLDPVRSEPEASGESQAPPRHAANDERIDLRWVNIL